MFDWDDLRVFIAAARAGTAAAAAKRLNLDATTVGRRIAALESALKATLFVRGRSGLQLTASGARLLETAAAVETAMNAAAEAGRADLVAGTVRISASEGFGGRILAPALPALRARHPELSIELIANPGFMSPLKREVDVAVTLSASQSARLLVEPLTDYELGLFASRNTWRDVRRPTGRRNCCRTTWSAMSKTRSTRRSCGTSKKSIPVCARAWPVPPCAPSWRSSPRAAASACCPASSARDLCGCCRTSRG